MIIADALLRLQPNAQFAIDGEVVEWIEQSDGSFKANNIQWVDTSIPFPERQELDEMIETIKLEYESLRYRKLRAKEYPDFKDYLDGIVKGDQTQIQAYIDACLAVKDKYPKP